MTAKVFHAHLYGTRESKYERLAESDVSTRPWRELHDKVIGQHGGWPIK